LKYSHPDIQIVLPLPRDSAHAIGHAIVMCLNEGMRFHPGTRGPGILEDYEVAFAGAKECGRPVLRVILPESNGALLPGEMANPTFRSQWVGCEVAAAPDGQSERGEHE